MSLFIKVAPPLLLILSHTFCGLAAQPRGGFVGNEAQIHGKSEGAPTTIEFREFFEADAGELRPSAKLLGLNGRRVRLSGSWRKWNSRQTALSISAPGPSTLTNREAGRPTCQLAACES